MVIFDKSSLFGIDKAKEILEKVKNGENVEKHEIRIETETYTYIAVCKSSGVEFNDYKNLSGVLTEHLKNNYPEIKHPTNFQKRNYKSKNGKYWHEQYFDIIKKEIIKKEVKKCAYCDWETTDLENKSGMYLTHLKKQHNISIENYLKSYPEDNNYFRKQNLDIQKASLLESSVNNFIVCEICGDKLKYMTNSHLKKHNINIAEYKEKYPKSGTLSAIYLGKLQEKYNETLKYCSNTFTSNAQKEIAAFLEDFGVICQLNNKKLLKGIEIDILSEEYKIGIEYNGNFYHTEIGGKKDKNYHLNKTKLMNDEDYNLVHIFEDEWHEKKELIKLKLLHIFNKREYSSKIFARNCIIKEIPSDLKNIFLNNYHIQGEDRSNVSIGAYYNDKLISVMTFDNNRQMNKKENNKDEYELKRFCSTSDCLVIGIAGKLLSYFVKKYNPKKIISFADRRWTLNSENNLYTKLGFKLTNILMPDYTYYSPKIHRVKRHHKFSFGKSSLKKKFPEIYNDNKTEWEMMQELGYDRIWDCGKFKYELDF